MNNKMNNTHDISQSRNKNAYDDNVEYRINP